MKKIENVKNTLNKFIWLLPPLIVCAAMTFLFKVNGLYPFTGKTIAWCDMDQQVIPLLLDFKDILAGKEGLFFSFKNAGGMNFFGVFFFFLSSPFSFLVAFVDKADISSFANILVMLKMCAISLTASLFFSRKYPGHAVPNVLLSVLYAYSGYTMMYYQNIIWLDMLYVFPLLLLSLDMLKEGKRLFFVCTLAACLFINYYISYMIVVFLLLYAFLWLIISKDRRFAGNFFFCCASAALLTAVVWLPSFVQYFSSGRKSSVIRNLQNSGLVTPYQTALPTVFSTLFLFPFTLSRKVSKDGKLRFILFLLTLVPLLIEPVNKMWQTGSYMSFPTRYAFMTIFLCLTLAMDCMTQPSAPSAVKERENDENTKKNAFFFGGRAPAVICSVLLGALALGYFLFSVNYTKENVTVMDQYSNTLWGNDASFEALLKLYLLAFGVGALCFALYKLGLLKPVGLWVCVGLLVVSELYVAPQTYMLSPAHETTGYRQIVDLADRIEDDGFYRVKTEREYSSLGFDVNMMGGIGYNALGHYTSLTGGGYMAAMKRFGYTSYWMEVGNSGGTVISDALMSVGYTISADNGKGEVYRNDSYGISKNDCYLPLGIVARRDIVGAAQNGADYSRRGELQKTLYADFFGDDEAVTVYSLEDAKLSNLDCQLLENGKYRLKPTSSAASISFSVPVKEKELLYFNAFDENTNALNQAINKKFSVSAPGYYTGEFPTQKNNGTALLGEYSYGTVTVKVNVKSEVTIRDIGVFGVKKEKFSTAAAGVKTLGLTAGKNSLSGRYTASGGECVFLSVAYDEGLSAKINGKKAPLYEVYDGFTAFYLEEGENEVVISFRPKGFIAGTALCVVGLGLCVGACVYAKRKGGLVLPQGFDTVAYYAFIAVGGLVIAAVYVAPILLCIL